jgi:hypothetical protein
MPTMLFTLERNDEPSLEARVSGGHVLPTRRTVFEDGVTHDGCDGRRFHNEKVY